MNILLDTMGGDNAPGAMVYGALDAIKEQGDFEITLLGDRRSIEDILINEEYDKSRLHIRHTTQEITNNDKPTRAIKTKQDSSMVVGFNMLNNKEGDVFISTGSSGALLIGAITILKRIPGIDRPALGSVIPSKKGRVLLVDSGLNMTCRPDHYEQFAYMGSAYMKAVFGIESPRIGLVNVGTEEEKGTTVIKEANKLLRGSHLNYVGYIEGKDLFTGVADVIVTDGFTGNVILKLIEGASKFIFSGLKNVLYESWRSKISALLLKKGLTSFKKSLDPDVNGGAPILGVNGLVIKSHGNSTAKTIKHVILKADALARSTYMDDIKNELEHLHNDKTEVLVVKE
ncbi:MAG: phosphate acyltransferase PlsX [Ruminococcaceae bacterium]|nr:phosphate acyltransferase PlsX [Oscillospiraceae bacterium]